MVWKRLLPNLKTGALGALLEKGRKQIFKFNFGRYCSCCGWQRTGSRYSSPSVRTVMWIAYLLVYGTTYFGSILKWHLYKIHSTLCKNCNPKTDINVFIVFAVFLAKIAVDNVWPLEKFVVWREPFQPIRITKHSELSHMRSARPNAVNEYEKWTSLCILIT